MSLGIDLRQVTVRAQGHTLILVLPPIEVLADSLTPDTITRSDFWYPLTEKQRMKLIEDERLSCRERCLAEQIDSPDAWAQTCRMLDATIAQWLDDGSSGLTIIYEQADEKPE